jgi:hypothetical protein
MLRLLYRCALRLHPPAFRTRFADEMLSIFDQEKKRLAAVRLLIDCFVSLSRQWALRPEFWYDLPAPSQHPAPDGIPSFYTIAPFRPRNAAVVHGLVISTAVFCLTCFAIKYSWIHVLHVSIPRVQFESPRLPQPNPPLAATDLSKRPPSPPFPQNPRAAAFDAQTSVAESSAAASSAEANAADLQSDSAAPHPRLLTPMQIPSSLRSYEGTYVVDGTTELKISIQAQDGHLVVSIAGEPKSLLTPVSATEFAMSEKQGCWIEFASASGTDADGRIRQLTLFENGHKFTARRQ